MPYFMLMCSQGAGSMVCTPLGDKISLLYGLQEQGEAYLLPALRLRWHRCLINQPMQCPSNNTELRHKPCAVLHVTRLQLSGLTSTTQ